MEHALPRLVSGAPLTWGDGPEAVEQTCGPLEDAPLAECRRKLVVGGATRWRSNLDIPRPRMIKLAFHRRRGFFEAMVYSDASPSELSQAVEARLGAPHRTHGSRRFWEYPRRGPRARLKVSGLGRHDARGRSAIKLYWIDVAQQYEQELDAMGCR